MGKKIELCTENFSGKGDVRGIISVEIDSSSMSKNPASEFLTIVWFFEIARKKKFFLRENGSSLLAASVEFKSARID